MLIARLPVLSLGLVLKVPVPLDDSGWPHAGDCCCAQCQAQPVQAVPEHASCSSAQSSSLDPSSPVLVVSSCVCEGE
jgi:hypothetical protein